MKYLRLRICMAVVFLVCVLLFSCKLMKDPNIPKEPTFWIVSEIYHDEKNPLPNGLVGYKLIPVNPGSLNAKSTWKLDYKGKYTVGMRVDFEPIPVDAPRSIQ